jgi:hypothetical protein
VAKAVLALIVFMMIVNELRVSGVASRLADSVATLELNELESTWSRHHELQRASSLGIGPLGLERALVRQTMTLAERVFANYRTPTPSVREGQWRAARTALAQALIARGDDPQVRAALRYCDGHLHRIDGEARKAERQATDAQREFAEALVAFREAAQLRPKWADPYLGLMRTFIYGLDDVERGKDALDQAVSRGYRAGDRETAQLAEGHRVRADRLVRSAHEVTGLGQELDYLNRAAADYRQSLLYYSQVPDFGSSARQLRTVQRGLAAAEQRIAALSAPAPAVHPLLESPAAVPAWPAADR